MPHLNTVGKKAHTMRISICTVSFIFCILFSSCRQPQSQGDYMALEEVVFIKDFPLNFSLEKAETVDIDIIGINSFCIYDSLIIFARNGEDEGAWYFASLPHYNYCGSFLGKGNGPYEFLQTPGLGSNTSLYEENDDLYAEIANFPKGEFYKFNISNSIKNKELDISLGGKLPPYVFFDFVRIDSARYFCRTLNETVTQQIRYILQGDSMSILPKFDTLNKASIREGEDINILSTIIKYNPLKDIIIEMPVGLNYINLYSLDGDFRKTICTEKKIYRISDIQKKMQWKRIYTYSDVRLFAKFWGVVCIYEEEMVYQIKRINKPVIQFFDWDGEPLVQLELEQFITSFDMDLNNGYLYTFNNQTDELFKYNIRHILSEIDKFAN